MRRWWFLYLCCVFSCTDAKDVQVISVALDWQVNPLHAGLITAERRGYLSQKGYRLVWHVPHDSGMALKMLLSRQVDAAVTGLQSYYKLKERGVPLKIVSVLVDKPLSCLLVNGHIQHLKELKGQRIGVSSKEGEYPQLEQMLQSVGLRLQDVHLVVLHYQLLQAFMMHRVDAVAEVYRNDEGVFAQYKDPSVHAYYPENFGVPQHDEIVLVSLESGLDSVKVWALQDGIRSAVRWLQQHPDQGWALWKREFPEFGAPVQYKIWQKTLTYLSVRPEYVSESSNRHYAEFLYQHGVLHRRLL